MCIKDCRHFGVCGGCSSPQTRYALSLKEKEQFLHELFAPLISSEQISPVIPCEPQIYGRNKMEFSFFQTCEGEKTLGFITPTKPRQGVSITHCLAMDPLAMEIVQISREWWANHPELMAYYPPQNKGSLCTLTVRKGNVNNDFMIIFTTSGREEYLVPRAAIEEWKSDLLKSSIPINSIYWEEKVSEKKVPTYFRSYLIYGEPYIKQRLVLPDDGSEGIFHVRPKSFFQPQHAQAARIIDAAKKLMAPTGDEVLLDLYCGAGTIGIMLSPYVKKVIGVEIVPEAIESAKENIIINGREGSVEVFLEDAKSFCQRQEGTSPDILIIDPPRCGLQSKVLKYVCRLAPKKIIYISCNPKTQLEECLHLVASGYEVKGMQPIDQFPHTPHLENVISLERSSPSFPVEP